LREDEDASGASTVGGRLRGPSPQAASAWLGAVLLALGVAGTLWSSGLGAALPPAPAVVAGHWAIGLILIVGGFATDGTARVLLAVCGLFLVAAGVTGFVAAGAVGEALGLSGPVPLAAWLLHLALGVAGLGGAALRRR
jgi:hypothetical protein